MVSRLTLALDSDAVCLPDGGTVLFMRPDGDHDLGGLDAGRVHVVQGFYPDHARLTARGFVVTPQTASGEAAVVIAQKAKALTLDLLARAMAQTPKGAPIIVDGAKADGIESIFKLCRKTLDCSPAFSKAHGKVFSFPNPGAAPAGWLAGRQKADGYVTAPGVFSADGIDPGSAALVAHLPQMKGRVCDLGAGWGYLSAQALAQAAITQIDLIEAEWDALQAAKINVTDPRAAFHWADARDHTGTYDWVISNPPFHIGRTTAPELGQTFIKTAARCLGPRGRFIMVANRHLPYEATLEATFGDIMVLAEAGGYKVVSAGRPRKETSWR